MKCSKCNEEFLEKGIEESHNVPAYLFEGDRNERKQQADKFPRKLLCKKCHDEYESTILKILYYNLLGKEIDLILDREERIKYFPKIHRICVFDKDKQAIAIKICNKIGGSYGL